MDVNTWRCIICGDPYVGEDKNTCCPFCGAPSKHIIPAAEYRDPAVKEVSEKSRNNIIEAIKLEVGNARFYFAASRAAKDIGLQARFRALGKVETEHSVLLSRIICAQPPVVDRSSGNCPKSDEKMVQESHDRESGAIKHYSEFLKDAVEPRVKQVFSALIEIETAHIELVDGTKFE
jgi:rubrerythrin